MSETDVALLPPSLSLSFSRRLSGMGPSYLGPIVREGEFSATAALLRVQIDSIAAGIVPFGAL